MGVKLAIIDGTGDFDNTDYAASMSNGFCKQLDTLRGADASYYQRGPSAAGLEDAYYMWNAVKWLTKMKKQDPSSRLMLAGYSRGASTVLAVASKLKDAGTEIDSMFLFDAVSRQVLLNSSDIVSTVKYCRHAVRTDDAKLVDKYEPYAVDYSALGYRLTVTNPLATNKMRPYFGHVALTAPAGVDFKSNRFFGSHGALGGVGWKDVPEDVPAQQAIAGWMNLWLKARQVPVSLVSYPPSS